MRNPISDANAGAAMDVAPSKVHATRAATVARTGNNQVIQDAAQKNQIASTLANAVGNFMGNKRKTELEQRYTEAFHKKGLDTGMTEYEKDLKRTGFTEFIYGGQSPEYQGALNAATRNASNAILLEEQEFVESQEGMAMTPQQYQQRIQQKITQYNAENFSDAPDAAFAFMKNWQDNSNELSRQQYKNNQVYQQQEARRTVAEGFQTDLDVYKNTLKSNPDRATKLGSKLYSFDNKPIGMSEAAYRNVLIEEGLTAVEAHDFAALQLMNASGITEGFTSKERKRYETAVNKIDQDNVNMIDAARLSYEEVIENPASSSADVTRARQMYDSARIQVSARDTLTAKHLKTISGADRWRGVLGNQYQAKLEAEEAERIANKVSRVNAIADDFEVSMLANTDAASRREAVAKRLDYIAVARVDPTLDQGVRDELNSEFVKLRKQLDTWESQEATRKRKDDELILKREQEEQERIVGIQSLLDGGGYVTATTEEQKVHIKGAVDSVMKQVLPDQALSDIDRIEQVFSNPQTTSKALRGMGKFSGYMVDSPEIKTAIKNLASNLQANLSGVDNNEFTAQQIQNMKSLQVVKTLAPTLYNKAFTLDEQVVNSALIHAMNTKQAPKETLRLLAQVEQRKGTDFAGNLKPDELAQLSVGNAPRDIQDTVYTVYKNHLVLGEDAAVQAAREFAQGYNTVAEGVPVRYGSTFEPVLGRNLDDTMKILGKTYKTGDTFKTGLTRVLSSLVGGSEDKQGNKLRNLKQVPDVRVSVLDGNLVFELNGRFEVLSRSELENEINGYTEWRNN